MAAGVTYSKSSLKTSADDDEGRFATLSRLREKDRREGRGAIVPPCGSSSSSSTVSCLLDFSLRQPQACGNKQAIVERSECQSNVDDMCRGGGAL